MGSAGYSCVIVSVGIQINGLAVWLLGDPQTLHVCSCVKMCARSRGDNECGLMGFLFSLFISHHKDIEFFKCYKSKETRFGI